MRPISKSIIKRLNLIEKQKALNLIMFENYIEPISFTVTITAPITKKSDIVIVIVREL